MTLKSTSFFLALIYIIIALYLRDWRTALRFALFLILPLACIWLSDDTKRGTLIAFVGWALLLGPIILGLAAWILGR